MTASLSQPVEPGWAIALLTVCLYIELALEIHHQQTVAHWEQVMPGPAGLPRVFGWILGSLMINIKLLPQLRSLWVEWLAILELAF